MEFHVFCLHEPRICFSNIFVCFISPAKIQMRWRKQDFLHIDSMAIANVKRKIEQQKTCIHGNGFEHRFIHSMRQN